MKRVLAGIVLVALSAAPLAAQFQIRLGGGGVWGSHQEINDTRRSSGFGFGGQGQLRFSRFSVDGSVSMVTLTPDSLETSGDFDMLHGDVRVGVVIANPFAIEVGAGGWEVDPEFSVQDVGYMKVGVRVESPITSAGDIALRGAYLIPKFSGSGEAGFAFQVGVLAFFGTSNQRFRIGFGYDFFRIDREIDELEAPIQLTMARFAAEIRL